MYINTNVCPFLMHLVPVKTSVTKLSVAHSQIQRKVERRLARASEVGSWVKFHPSHDKLQSIYKEECLSLLYALVPVKVNIGKLSMAYL
jgi:hypothetical protein